MGLIDAFKDKAKTKTKKVVKKLLRRMLKAILPFILVLLLAVSAILVIPAAIKDGAETVISSVSSVFSNLFDNTSDSPAVVIDNELVKRIGEELKSKQIKRDDTYLTDELILKSLEAYYATQYPYIDGIDYKDDMVQGCIYLKRGNKDMKYTNYNFFKTMLGSGKSYSEVVEAKKYFSMNDNQNIVVINWNPVYDEWGNIIYYEIFEAPEIDHKTLTSQYAMSYKFPILLANLYSNAGFGCAVADLAKNSRIEISILDSTVTTKTTINEYYKMRYKLEGIFRWQNLETDSEITEQIRNLGWGEAHQEEKEIYNDSESISQTNTIKVQVTGVDTWVVRSKDKVKLDLDERENATSQTTYPENDPDGWITDKSIDDLDESDIEKIKKEISKSRRDIKEGAVKEVIGSVTKKMEDHKVTTTIYTKEEVWTASNMTLVDNTDKFLALIKAKSGKWDPDGKLVKYYKNKNNELEFWKGAYNVGTNTIGGGASNLTGYGGVPAKIADFLLSKGMPLEGIAAVLGNIEQECTFDPANVTGNYIGIVQWGLLYAGKPSRGTYLKEYAIKQGTDWTDLDTQLNFMWKELNGVGYESVKSKLMKATNVKETTEYFARYYERCVNPDGSIQQLYERQQYAEKWYTQLKSKYVLGSSSSNKSENTIVITALKYDGNTYVYGGSSLTSGCDCSHFVWLVLKEAGAISKSAGYLNTSGIMSEAQSKWNCTKIGTDASKAQPGDIIVYRPGNIHHVAIYMGDGKIVEAQNATAGITSNRTLTHESIAGIFRPKK